MGTIQNAFNQMLATAAGGITSAKVIHNQAEAAKQADISNKFSALNQAESYEAKAKEFNEDVKGYETAMNDSMEQFYKEYIPLKRSQPIMSKPGSEEWIRYNQLMHKAEQSELLRSKELRGQREGLVQRKNILEEKKKLGETVLGKNNFSNITLSEPANVEDHNKLRVHSIIKGHIKHNWGNK